MTIYQEGVRLRSVRYPEMGEGVIRRFSNSHNMWIFEFDTPNPHHWPWPTHNCQGTLPSNGGRYFYESEFLRYFEFAGPKERKRTGFAQFLVDKQL